MDLAAGCPPVPFRVTRLNLNDHFNNREYVRFRYRPADCNIMRISIWKICNSVSLFTLKTIAVVFHTQSGLPPSIGDLKPPNLITPMLWAANWWIVTFATRRRRRRDHILGRRSLQRPPAPPMWRTLDRGIPWIIRIYFAVRTRRRLSTRCGYIK